MQNFQNLSFQFSEEIPQRGNPPEWQSFYDQFNISIHQNKTLNDIDRFNYLGRYLAGQALATITALTLNSENYNEALDILIDR